MNEALPTHSPSLTKNHKNNASIRSVVPYINNQTHKLRTKLNLIFKKIIKHKTHLLYKKFFGTHNVATKTQKYQKVSILVSLSVSLWIYFIIHRFVY